MEKDKNKPHNVFHEQGYYKKGDKLRFQMLGSQFINLQEKRAETVIKPILASTEVPAEMRKDPGKYNLITVELTIIETP